MVKKKWFVIVVEMKIDDYFMDKKNRSYDHSFWWIYYNFFFKYIVN